MTLTSAALAAPRTATLSRHYRAAEDAFPALPPGFGRDQLIGLIERVAHRLPVRVGTAALNTLRRMAGCTRPGDWTSQTAEPVCYMAQTELAALAGLDPKRIRAHEAVLARAGLIEKRTAANGARSGYLRCGIYFTIAIARLDEWRALEAQIDAERRMHAELRGLRSTHRLHLTAALAELSEIGANPVAVAAIRAAFEAWPEAGALHRMDLEALETHESQADALTREALELLDHTLKTSGRPDENARPYIQATTYPESVSCNVTVDKRSAADAAQDSSFGAPANAGPQEGLDESVESGPAAHKSEFLARLGPDRLYQLASEEMRFYLDARRGAGGRLTFHDFVLSARMRRPELGINASVWRLAVTQGGEELATLCLLVTDARRTGAVPVLNPGGHMRAMVRAHELGQLNLTQSLIGLSERRRAEAARERQ